MFCRSCEQPHSTQGVRRLPQPVMKLLDQARFAEPRLTDDQHQLAVALPRPLPAPHQHRHLVVAADQRRELAGAGASSAAARADDPEQNRRLGYTFQRVRAALFRHEQSGDLALHPRRDQHRAWLGERLHTRGDVRYVPVDFSGRIHHRWTSLKANAGGEHRLAGAGILAVKLRQRSLDRKCRPRRALGIVLLCDRIAEQHHQSVAQLLGDVAAHFAHRRRGGVEIGADQVAPFLCIKLRGNAGRADEVAEHHSEIAPLAGGFDRGGDTCRRNRSRDRRRYDRRRRGCLRRCTAQFGDGLQQLLAMAERGYADVLEIIVGQPAHQLAVDVVGAEQLGILGETDLAEPTVDVQVQSSRPVSAAVLKMVKSLRPP